MSCCTRKVVPVIAIVNQKGGTGKTTLSTNLAAAFAETGRVLLFDADAQGNSHDWADARDRPGSTWTCVRRILPGCCRMFVDCVPSTTG